MTDDRSFYVRPAKQDDLINITELIIACDIDEWGEPDFSKEDLQEIWDDISLDTNTFIIQTFDYSIVGYGFIEEISEGRIDCYGFVAPNQKGLGVGSLLVKAFHDRASYYIDKYKKLGVKHTFNIIIPAKNKKAVCLMKENGFSFSRLHSKMSIDIDTLNAYKIPETIKLKLFDAQTDWELLFDLYNHCFKDTREHREQTLDMWMTEKTSPGYDKTLWYIAYLNDEPSGFIMCKKSPEAIWIDLLGVINTRRNLGVAKTLLNQIFQDCYTINFPKVQLMVDANSLTNANLLYEKVGMKAIYQIAVFSKN
ncbi:MAG: GNAT family N-acetyltransferase [Anaerobacillus sp.]|uniref:GNAT family N-acetyltransferase n=1 Tax=Anaerobacillus sp. TaxID=1872506 RepID=UPI00391CCCA3